jgi:metal-responsive CopG/Arc/MetJ family transcriptional regulator
VPADLVKKIDDNRGDVNRAQFIEALIDNLIEEKPESKEKSKAQYATKEEILVYQQDMKQLLKSFLDFFMAYGMEFGDNGQLLEIEKFTSKLQGLQKDIVGEDAVKSGGGRATIKWKP